MEKFRCRYLQSTEVCLQNVCSVSDLCQRLAIYLDAPDVEEVLFTIIKLAKHVEDGAVFNQQFIVHFGIFTALPMVIENSEEHGFLIAVWDTFTMQLQLASVFYTFSMGTRTHFFGRTILHGGAKYRATGHGFVVQHKRFAKIYRLYSRSHFVKAIEFGILLIVYASFSKLNTDTLVYIILKLSSWFLVFSWTTTPFIFNPSGFDWLKTVYDFDDFMNWIWYKGGKADQCWEVWWYEEHDHLHSTGFQTLRTRITDCPVDYQSSCWTA